MIMGEAGKAQGCVLVVDDDEQIRETLSELVEMLGCSVVTAANGREALAVLAKWRPCLIILDLRMPVMNGQELLKEMKQEPSLAALPVLISTSAPDQAPIGLPVLPKPIDIDRLVGWLSQTCQCLAPLAT